MTQKLLIADDEIMLTQLLADHLTNNGYLTYTAYSSEEVISKLHIQPDLILLDINMPGMDGLELCKIIRDQVVCPIIFLTARVTEADKINGLQAGGDDYVTKPFSLQELTARIASHLRREERGKCPPRLITSRGLIINLSERTCSYNGIPVTFSRREFDIIEFLMSNPNQVFDKEQLYEAVWGLEAEGSSNVIKEHIRKIRAKLTEITGAEYIETIWGIGYKWNN